MKIADIPAAALAAFRKGCVIPAMPLALGADRRLSPRHQRALVRYYLDAGAGGIAVAVHTTQFEIRDPAIGLFESVLELAGGTVDAWSRRSGRPALKVAGVCGPTAQALREAGQAADLGYHACLLSLAALAEASGPDLLAHCRAVADVMPVLGFYLQPAVGGRVLPFAFWRRFVEIDNVLGIKVAAFNRYQTFDVVRAVAEAGRADDVTLYTGNDDHIVLDLLTAHRVAGPKGAPGAVGFAGGLLGHWAVWTRKAVEMLERIRAAREGGKPLAAEWLTLAVEVTDCNAAFFDTANGFAGCIPGIHEVLHRQGLLPTTACLDPELGLSPGQREEIDRVYAAYPHLNDDAFVREQLPAWLE